jgi:hypothetical protein
MDAENYDEVMKSFNIGMFENNEIESISTTMTYGKIQVNEQKECNEETDINVNDECLFYVDQSD